MSKAIDLLNDLKSEIETFESSIISKDHEIESLKISVSNLNLEINSLKKTIVDLEAQANSAPVIVQEPQKTIIDEHATVIKKWGKPHYNQTVNYSNILLKNSQGWYFENCDVVIDNCEFENIYAVIFEKCRVRIISPKMLRTKRAFDFRNTLNWRIEGLYDVSYTQDFPIPNDPNLNGDGFITDEASTGGFVENMYSHHNADAGLDCKANNLTVVRLKTELNRHGVKLWGDNLKIGTMVAQDNKTDGIFQIKGSLTVNDFTANRNAEHHIHQGLHISYSQGWTKTMNVVKMVNDNFPLIYQDKSWGGCSATINGKVY